MKSWSSRLPGLYWKAKPHHGLDNSLSFLLLFVQNLYPEPTLKYKDWSFKKEASSVVWQRSILRVRGSNWQQRHWFRPRAACILCASIADPWDREGAEFSFFFFNWVLLSFSASVARTLLKGTKAHGGVKQQGWEAELSLIREGVN